MAPGTAALQSRRGFLPGAAPPHPLFSLCGEYWQHQGKRAATLLTKYVSNVKIIYSLSFIVSPLFSISEIKTSGKQGS